jgi:hypothetical protein
MLLKALLKRRERRERKDLLCHVRESFDRPRRVRHDLFGLCDLCASSFGRRKQS